MEVIFSTHNQIFIDCGNTIISRLINSGDNTTIKEISTKINTQILKRDYLVLQSDKSLEQKPFTDQEKAKALLTFNGLSVLCQGDTRSDSPFSDGSESSFERVESPELHINLLRQKTFSNDISPAIPEARHNNYRQPDSCFQSIGTKLFLESPAYSNFNSSYQPTSIAPTFDFSNISQNNTARINKATQIATPKTGEVTTTKEEIEQMLRIKSIEIEQLKEKVAQYPQAPHTLNEVKLIQDIKSTKEALSGLKNIIAQQLTTQESQDLTKNREELEYQLNNIEQQAQAILLNSNIEEINKLEQKATQYANGNSYSQKKKQKFDKEIDQLRNILLTPEITSTLSESFPAKFDNNQQKKFKEQLDRLDEIRNIVYDADTEKGYIWAPKSQDLPLIIVLVTASGVGAAALLGVITGWVTIACMMAIAAVGLGAYAYYKHHQSKLEAISSVEQQKPNALFSHFYKSVHSVLFSPDSQRIQAQHTGERPSTSLLK